jgi:hypothetical protein
MNESKFTSQKTQEDKSLGIEGQKGGTTTTHGEQRRSFMDKQT